MKRHYLRKALVFGAAAASLVLAGCSTTESRISEHPDIYQSLSPNDQALVTRGQIRTGMSQGAVWLAWGSPEQKTQGAMRKSPTETWIYLEHYAAPYGSGFGYGYGGYGFGPYGYGYPFGFGGGVFRTHHGARFAFFGSPFYDPFYYSYFPPSITYPSKLATFSNGRVVSYQYLVPGSAPQGY
jgi:hypothetical protein